MCVCVCVCVIRRLKVKTLSWIITNFEFWHCCRKWAIYQVIHSQAEKAYGEVEVWSHTLLTAELDGDEVIRFTPRSPYPRWNNLQYPRLDALEKIQSLSFAGNWATPPSLCPWLRPENWDNLHPCVHPYIPILDTVSPTLTHILFFPQQIISSPVAEDKGEKSRNLCFHIKPSYGTRSSSISGKIGKQKTWRKTEVPKVWYAKHQFLFLNKSGNVNIEACSFNRCCSIKK